MMREAKARKEVMRVMREKRKRLQQREVGLMKTESLVDCEIALDKPTVSVVSQYDGTCRSELIFSCECYVTTANMHDLLLLD